MARVLIGSPRHPAFAAVAAVVDQTGTLCKPSAVKASDRVVVLVGYGDLAGLAGKLQAVPGLSRAQTLLVVPGLAPASSLGQSIAQAAAEVGASTLCHAPLSESLLHARHDITHRRALVLCPLNADVAWLAAADLAQQAVAWLEGVDVQTSAIVGPMPLDGAGLARQLNAVLAKLSEPADFVRQRFAELDENGDGLVEHAEATAYLVELGLSPSTAVAMAQTADLNGDGVISLSEFASGVGPTLKTALSRMTSPVTWTPAPANLLRDDWVSRGMPFGEASARIEHFTNGAVEGRVQVGTISVITALRAHALAFVQLYILPGGSLLTLRAGRFGEPDPNSPSLLWSNNHPQLMLEATLSRKQLSTGEVLSSRWAGKGGPVEVRWCNTVDTEVIRYGEGETACAIELSGDRLVGLACRGAWPALRDTVEGVQEKRPLKKWQKTLFRELGALKLDQINELSDPSEVICHCAGVTRGMLSRRADAGPCTLAQVAQSSGATRVCGGCTPAVAEILGTSRLEVAEISSKRRLGQDIFELTLHPVSGPAVPSLPGQHIVLQGRIHGRWVTRAYTLISPAGQQVPYQLAIKREEMGVFSRWLADTADDSTLLRCSPPSGDVFIGPDVAGPVLVLAGGIGITPGIAIARSLASDQRGRQLHIDWSARHSHDFVFAHELDQLSGKQISWTRRCTSESARLDASYVHEHYPWQDGAVAVVCGPGSYTDEVASWLKSGGWPEDAIQVEIFASNVESESPKRPAPPSTDGVPTTDGPEQIQYDSFFVDLQRGREVGAEAAAFLQQMYRENRLESVLPERLTDVRAELEATGTYTLTHDELAYGAQLAWRNSTRCIGRFFWQHLHVRDMRHLETEEQLFDSIVDHMRLATNGGDIVSTVTVFRHTEPTIRVWNGQLIRYAGYRQPDGSVVGDPANCELTEKAQALGWQGGGGRFDVLPLVIQIGDRAPKWFELPSDAVLEVPLEHPDFPWFADLGLRWYALPAVSELALDVGGVLHRCVPFNGFYMVTEIGARNLSDTDRYNQLPVVADRMGLDRSDPSTMWKDRALVELNVAVMHSFKKHNVRMLDHHAMADFFHAFEAKEKSCGRPVYGDWSWLVPPLSGSTSSLFFRDDLKNVILKPMFQYQHSVWKGDLPRPDHEGPVPPCPFHQKA